MNLNPFINLLANIISLYTFGLFVWMIIGWLIRFNIINGYQVLVKQIMIIGRQLFEPALHYIRKFIPSFGGIDLSPLVLFLLLNFTKEILFTYFYKI